jgi:hypothetical protein
LRALRTYTQNSADTNLIISKVIDYLAVDLTLDHFGIVIIEVFI